MKFINIKGLTKEIYPSPPSRGAWIEIQDQRQEDKTRKVAPLAGGVD